MRWWYHIIFWTGIWIWMTTVYLYNPADFIPFLLANLLRLPVIIAATYAVARFVVKDQILSFKPNYAKAVGIFLLIFLTATLLDRFINGNQWLVPTLNGEQLIYEFFLVIPLAKNAFLLFSIMGLGALIQFFRTYSLQKQEIHLLKEEKLESELSFLKSQVNPHFLFNTFNNLYSIANSKGQHELAKGLEAMSGLMRYLTYHSNVARVDLAKEIALLESFIDLQKLRLGDNGDLSIVFRVMGETGGKVIAPVLLLPLVENAFKHGYDGGVPSWISILLSVNNGELNFEVKNKKISSSKSNGGIGLSNLQKRLKLIYPGEHTMTIEENEQVYKIKLTLPLARPNHPITHE